jgi:hypothetical protein
MDNGFGCHNELGIGSTGGNLVVTLAIHVGGISKSRSKGGFV